MNLWTLPAGCSAQVTSFSSQLPSSYLLRLKELGINQGECIECLQNTPFGGPKVYRIGDAVFSIEKPVAGAVNVSALSPATTAADKAASISTLTTEASAV